MSTHSPEDGAKLTGQIRLWWLSWDGPAYPSGTQVAEAVTASDWFADAINSAIETGRQEVYATLGAVTAERDRLRELLHLGIELDNHHNASICPYCTPNPERVIVTDEKRTEVLRKALRESTVRITRDALESPP